MASTGARLPASLIVPGEREAEPALGSTAYFPALPADQNHSGHVFKEQEHPGSIFYFETL